MYAKFLLKINKGNTESGVACDLPRFALLINEVKNWWVERGIKDKDSILIDSYQEIVKTKEILTPVVVKSDYVEFDLEEDYYEGILLKCVAVKSNCKKTLFSREVKNQNKNLLQFDESNKPDFDWEWTFHSIQNNKIRVYKSEFDIISAIFEYYSSLPTFDIEGYINIDGTPSSNQELPLSDQYIDQIINLAAKEFEMNYQNVQNVQIAQERLNTQE